MKIAILLLCAAAFLGLQGCCARSVKAIGGSSPPGVSPIDCGAPPANSAYVTVKRHWFRGHSYNVNVDQYEPGDSHPEICLSVVNGDKVKWTHSPGKPRLGFPVAKPKDQGCKEPFVGTHPGPNDFRDSHQSSKLNKDMIGCRYDLTFNRENKTTSDPHIVIGGKGGT